MRVRYCGVLVALAIGGCSNEAPVNSSAVNLDSVAEVSTPQPRYDDSENGIYFYASSVSDEDKKKGRAVGDVVGFRYLGQDSSGRHKIGMTSDSGEVISRYSCSNPCKIIKNLSSGERIPFDNESIIGAAFEDAINGLLKEKAKTAVADESAYPKFVSSVPAAFQGAWDEMVQDKCEAREPRFVIDAKEFYNFEVAWDVTQVKLYSPTEMDLHTTTKDENGAQVNEVWEFKLTDKDTLGGRKPGGSFFRRCQSA